MTRKRKAAAQIVAGGEAQAQVGEKMIAGAGVGVGARSLRDWRLARGLTQFQLAGRAEVSLTSERNIERGKQSPTLATAQKLARALGVSLDQVAWPESAA